ncbi:MAG: lactate racemase domain-containing protein [Spirochaetaceae bacterium]|nr:lactate racemase domain-containing protein [Spirochaetaceae bacterium]
MAWFFEKKKEISKEEIKSLVLKSAEECLKKICANPKKVLLLPPDITRAYSGCGWIAEILYNYFDKNADVFVMPTLGQHIPHTEEQNKKVFGAIPESRILKHDSVKDVKKIGEIPADYVKKATSGAADWKIPIEINPILLTNEWDIIINIGHVVPHEVLGFASHNKNYFIGLGGNSTISSTHIASACYGIENILGSIISPIRDCLNKAEREFLGSLPFVHILLVMALNEKGKLSHTGFYCGNDFETYLLAAEHSRQENIVEVPPLKKIIAVMDKDEFESTWVSNKAIYRTRKALADNGELIIIAPGLKRFGENQEADKIIREYGYSGTNKIIDHWKKDKKLQDMAHVTAHLIHGSSDQRFKIYYAPGYLTKKDIESVNYNYLDLSETLKKYPIEKMKYGFNIMGDGEKVYFINAPASGLWATKEKINNLF